MKIQVTIVKVGSSPLSYCHIIFALLNYLSVFHQSPLAFKKHGYELETFELLTKTQRDLVKFEQASLCEHPKHSGAKGDA